MFFLLLPPDRDLAGYTGIDLFFFLANTLRGDMIIFFFFFFGLFLFLGLVDRDASLPPLEAYDSALLFFPERYLLL